MDRKKILNDIVREETSRFSISRFIEEYGTAVYNLAAEQKLEGVVAKKIDSKYYFGKRTKDWIKIKALHEEDFIVCGYYFKAENLVSVILGQYEGNEIKYQSHVVMGVSRKDYSIIASSQKTNKSTYYNFPDFQEAVWLKPVFNSQYLPLFL